ncbi:MAG TPA: hypothetical protein VLA05_01100 [Coriobacteriia bacterium]|nr:hypothetical protein [Coriobacteriia bacterium]
MHDNVTLAGPLWVIAQFIVLAALVLSFVMLADSLRPTRRANAKESLSEPLWLYTGAAGAFLALLIIVQLVPGVQLGAAAVAIASPLILALGMVYLLRVVFPKQRMKSE